MDMNDIMKKKKKKEKYGIHYILEDSSRDKTSTGSSVTMHWNGNLELVWE